MISLAIEFPNFNPELIGIDIGNFRLAIRWYALAYIVGLLIGWRLFVLAIRRGELWPGDKPAATEKHLDDFLVWAIVGIILGGRIGYVLGYGGDHFLQNPGDILKVWQGGMSFHGGFLGVVIAAFIFGIWNKLKLLSFADGLALAAPAGLLLGRIANFINAELWGRPTSVAWGVIFPGEAAQYCPGFESPCARHPSQLYEAGLEGALLLAAIVFLIYRRGWLKAPGRIAGLFFAGYGVARIFVEEFRMADAQFVTLANPQGNVLETFGLGLSMGQVLSLPMVVAGLILMATAKKS